MIHSIIRLSLLDKRHADLSELEVVAAAIYQTTNTLMASTDNSGGGGNTSCEHGAPGNPTEVEPITTITVAADAPVHTTVTGSVVVYSNLKHNGKSLQ